MAQIDDLKAYGANVDEGVSRCIGNPDFYLKMVKKASEDKSIDDLKRAIDEKDLGQAFEIAHALKGVFANLALTPVTEPVSEMVELLRNRTDTDYSGYLEKVDAKFKELQSIMQ